jgi:hypothetical protein
MTDRPTRPRITRRRPAIRMPASGGRPVLLVPGPKRHSYLEAMRRQLPLVAHPPTNVGVAGTVINANVRGLRVRIPRNVRRPPAAGPLHMVPPFAVPGSTVRVAFVSTSHFLLAHGEQSLSPGSPILVMGKVDGKGVRAVLVTDLSGMRAPSRASAHRIAAVTNGEPTPGQLGTRLVADRQVAASGNGTGIGLSQDLVASGDWGWDGFNLGIDDAHWGSQDGCPYFGFKAQLTLGFGAEWDFPLQVDLDARNRVAVTSMSADQASGFDRTFYSAFGGAAALEVTASCKLPIPEVTIFGHTFGGGSIGPTFTFGPDYELLLQNQTSEAAPLWTDSALRLPATTCFKLEVPRDIPGLGTVWGAIHLPEIESPLCADLDIQPAGFRATIRPPGLQEQGIALGDHQAADLQYVPPPGSKVHLDTFSFTPTLDAHLTYALGVGWPSHSEKSKIPKGATARCKDGSYSASQHARGTCSHHGGIAEKLDPSQDSGRNIPDSSWQKLLKGYLETGPSTLPIVELHRTLDTTWNPSSVDFSVAPAPPPKPVELATSLRGNLMPPTSQNGGYKVDITVADQGHPAGDPTATGSVTVKLGGRSGPTIGSSVLSHGHARWMLQPGDPGDNSIAAYYGGDTTHAASAICLRQGVPPGKCP